MVFHCGDQILNIGWLSIFEGIVEEFGDLIVGYDLLRFLVEHKNGKVKTNTAYN